MYSGDISDLGQGMSVPYLCSFWTATVELFTSCYRCISPLVAWLLPGVPHAFLSRVLGSHAWAFKILCCVRGSVLMR